MLSCMEPRVGDIWRKLELDETLLNESLSKTLTTLVLVSTNSRGAAGCVSYSMLSMMLTLDPLLFMELGMLLVLMMFCEMCSGSMEEIGEVAGQSRESEMGFT